MADAITLTGYDPETLAAAVYTKSVMMHPDSFCGILDKTSSMYCSKSAFCSYNTDVGRAGCCATETAGGRRYTYCPFQTACKNSDDDGPTWCTSTPCVDHDKEHLFCYKGLTCQTLSWTDFGPILTSFSCGQSPEAYTVEYPETFLSYLKTEVLHMTEQIRIVTSTISFDTISSSITPKVTSVSSSSSKTSASRVSSTLSTSTTSPTTLSESSSSSTVSSGVVGAVSSVGAVIVCALLAWILVRRQRKRDEKTRLEQDNADVYAHPAPYTYPMDQPHSVEAIKHASVAPSELDGNMQVMVRESLMSELERLGSSSVKHQREAQAPSEHHSSTHLEPTSRRPSPLSYVTGQTPQTNSMWLSDDNRYSESLVRQSRLPEGVVELPA